MNRQFVVISKRNPRYFELEDGTPFLPVGCNLCFQRNLTEPEEIFKRQQAQMESFAANGGNFMRVWLGSPFLELEPERMGEFNLEALARIERLVGMADKLGIRIKFTFDHFRRMDDAPEVELFPGAAKFRNTAYRRENGGCADSMEEFLRSPEARKAFVKRLELLARHFADNPTVMAWELWNEMNAVDAPESAWMDWTEAMLKELRRLFPRQLALQSLGSYCDLQQEHQYNWLCRLEDNAFSQAHRYLDPGASIDIARGPMDLLCADAITKLLSKAPLKPALLAECGAVEWSHCRMSHLYDFDRKGMLLHDELFAPFFAGSAGCGHPWHWDLYIERHNLWHHFKRFAKAVEGLDPVEEDFKASLFESRRLRFYVLKGKRNSAVWCRDKLNTWSLELDRGQTPETLKDQEIALQDLDLAPQGKVSLYLPWSDVSCEEASNGGSVKLPAFERSIVIRIKNNPLAPCNP